MHDLVEASIIRFVHSKGKHDFTLFVGSFKPIYSYVVRIAHIEVSKVWL